LSVGENHLPSLPVRQRALPHEVAGGFAFDPMLCNVALAMNSHSEFPQDSKIEGLPYFYSIL
jgi:hypothetical protein